MAFRNNKRQREFTFNRDNFDEQNNETSNEISSHGYHNPDYNPRNFWQEHEFERRDFDNVNENYPEDYERAFEDFDNRESRMRTEGNHFSSRRRNREGMNPNLRMDSEEEGYQRRNQEDYIGDHGSGTYYKPGDQDPGDTRNNYYYDNYTGDQSNRDEEYEYFEREPSSYRRESRERSYLNPLYGNANDYPEGRYSNSRYEFENWGDEKKKNTLDQRPENYRRRRPNIRENKN